MQTKEFLTAVETAYKNHFPASASFARLRSGLGKSINVTCYLAADSSENSGNYWDNDMFNVRFFIDLPADTTLESDIPASLVMEVMQNSYAIKPETTRTAFGRRKFSWRKTSGDAGKILKTLDKYFAQLRESVVADFQNGMIADRCHAAVAASKLSGEI